MGYFDMESRQVIPGPVGFVVVGRLGVGAAPSRGSLGPNARLRQYIKPGNIVALPGKTVEDLRQYPEA